VDPDLALVIGLLIAAFSIPSVLSAISDRRAPRASALTILIGGALILYAMSSKPGGYSLQEIPDTFIRILAQFMP
jgi:hypothetical protein